MTPPAAPSERTIPVRIPTPLRSYTGAAVVQAAGATLDELLVDLDRRHPGIRFRMVDEQERIRRHVRVFVGTEDVRWTGDLATRVSEGAEITIVPAVSGG